MPYNLEGICLASIMKTHGRLMTMPQRRASLKIDLPIASVTAICDQVCKEVVQEYGWEIKDNNKVQFVCNEKNNILLGHYPVKIEIRVIPEATERTIVNFAGSNFGLGPIQSGHLEKQMNLFIHGIKEKVAFQEGLREDEKKIMAGILCPTCRSPLAPGTRFCPNDGTPITRQCPNPECRHANAPSAQFCEICGTKMQ